MSKEIDLNQNEQYGTQVICPYCGNIEEEEYPGHDSEEIDCDDCGKKFYAYSTVRYTSQKNCNLNGLDCDFKPLDNLVWESNLYDWFKCEGCQTTVMKRKVSV